MVCPCTLKYNMHTMFYYSIYCIAKTLAFFAVSEPFVKVFSAKVCGHTYIIIGRARAISESFLCEILVLYRNAKLFSLEIFPLYGTTF